MTGMKDGIPDFRECVGSRYQNDLIMNGFATTLVLLVPAAVLAVVSMLKDGGGKYAVLADHVPSYTLVCIVLELFVIMVVVYNLYSRLYSHSRRDSRWRRSLISYVSSKGGDTSKMAACSRLADDTERFPGMIIARSILGVMLLFTIWVMLYVVPVLPSDASGSPDYVLILGGSVVGRFNSYYFSVACSALMCLSMILVAFARLLSFTYGHEQRQAEFTRFMAESLRDAGIQILPMTPVVKKMNIFLNFLIFMFTGGFYILYLVFKVFRNMNNHLMNNWVYEEELLRAVESDGRAGFDSEFYNRSPDKGFTGRKRKGRRFRKFARQMRAKARRENRLPGALVLAEIFLIVLCSSYVLKIIAMGCDMSQNYEIYHVTLDNFISMRPSAWVRIALVVMDVYFMMTAIGSILGLASRRAASWRKVVRSCVTFVAPLWITALITKDSGMLHLFDFNVYVTTFLLALILVMMIRSEKIRRFYAPVGHEMPEMKVWIRYAFWGSIITSTAAGAVLGEDLGDAVELPDADIRE